MVKGCGMGPWLVLVSHCFRENVVVTCRIGSFLCSLDNLLQKNVIVLTFHIFSHQGKLQKILQHISHSHTYTHPIDLFYLNQFWKKYEFIRYGFSLVHCKNGVLAIDTSFVISFETCLFIDTKSCLMQNMFKGNASMQDTRTQIMSSCKTLQFRKTCLLSLVGRHDLMKDMSSCLKMHFYSFYLHCFILLKTCLFPRHVLNMAPRHDFHSVWVLVLILIRTILEQSINNKMVSKI